MLITFHALYISLAISLSVSNNRFTQRPQSFSIGQLLLHSGASISLETWSGPSPSLYPLPLSLSPPSFPFLSPPLPFPFPFSCPNSPPSLSPSSPLIQLGVWGSHNITPSSVVSSPSGVRAEPRPLTHFVYFKLGNDGRCQRSSVIVMYRKMFQTKAH